MSMMITAALLAAVQRYYPVQFGAGGNGLFDMSTGLWYFTPNVGGRIIFYTPAGTDTGPFTITYKGASYTACYTRTTLLKCQQISTGKVGGAVPTQGDFILLPQGTTTMAMPDVTFGSALDFFGSTDKTKIAVLGTYDSTDQNNPAKFNLKPAYLDYGAIRCPLVLANWVGRGERNFAIINVRLKGSATAVDVQAILTSMLGTHSGVLIQQCVEDAGGNIGITMQGGGPGYGQTATSLTSSGTLATMTCSNAAMMTAVQLGAAKIAVNCPTGDQTYNGLWTPTWVDSTHLTFPFPGNGNIAASGTINVCVPQIYIPEGAGLFTDVVLNQCGVSYCHGMSAAHSQGVYVSNMRRLRQIRCIFHNNGWARQGNRGTPGFFSPQPTGNNSNRIVSVTNSNGVATVTLEKPASLTAGTSFVALAGILDASYANALRVLTVIDSTHFTMHVNPNVPTGLMNANQLAWAASTAYTTVSPASGIFANGSAWSCTVNGTSASSGTGPSVAGWAAATVYTAGQFIMSTVNGVTAIYQCAVGGTSAAGATAGPSGTGAGIVDGTGTLTWNWISASGAGSTFTVADGAGALIWKWTGANGVCVNPEGNGWVAAAGNSPDQFNHNVYSDSGIDDYEFHSCIDSWDSANMKMSGAPAVYNHFSLRNPIGFLFGNLGNDTNGLSWAGGGAPLVVNHIQAEGSNITSVAGDGRGGTDQMGACLGGPSGSYQYNTLVVNLTNCLAPLGFANTYAATNASGGPKFVPTAGFRLMGLIGNYPGAAQANVGAEVGVTKTFNGLWTTDSSTTITAMNTTANSSGNLQISSLPVALQTAIALAQSFNVYDTFRGLYPLYFSGVSGGTALTREAAMMDIMVNLPEVQWQSMLAHMYRAQAGLGR